MLGLDMNYSLLLWLTLAVGLFWCVGVYNRLMRMRAQGLDAWVTVEKELQQYADLVSGQASLLVAAKANNRSVDPVSDWSKLTAVWREMDQALKEAVTAPLAEEPLARLATCLDELRRAWAAVCEAPADLAGPIVPDTLRSRWETVALSVEASCNRFNHMMKMYNQALTQFPASLIVGLLAFKPAGRL